MSGISGIEIGKFIKKYGGTIMNREFAGVYSADTAKKFSKFKARLEQEKHSIPFCIVNTDPKKLPGTHWITILNICPREEIFIFDPFGDFGFSMFIKSDDEDIIGPYFGNSDDIVSESENEYDSVVENIGFKSIVFKADEYAANMTEPMKKELTPACRGLLELFTIYSRANKKKNIVCHFIRDQLQETNSVWCGVFSLYFLYNLFNPVKRASSNANITCNIRHMKMIINEIFNKGTTNGRALNSDLMKEFAKNYNIKGDFKYIY